jgi:hypothetical protein
MLFVAIDIEQGRVMCAWLVPSPMFAKIVPAPNARGLRIFAASMKDASQDQWRPYRLTAAELAPRLLNRLAELDGVQ